MNINLKLLYTFVLVAEHSSFSQAAERSNRSVPAVSMQIRQLEEQIGLTLFRRTTRKVELTNEGLQLLDRVRKGITEIDVGLLLLRGAAEIQNARIAISCTPTVAGTRLPLLLSAFSKDYPGVTVGVRELGVGDLLDSVRKGEVDFGIGPRMPRMRGLDFRHILNDEYYALVDPDHRPLTNRGITLRELASLPVLGLGAGSAFREDVLRAANSAGVELKTHYEFMNISTMVAMAEQGLGVALVPSISIPIVTRMKPLRIVEPVIKRDLGIIALRGQTLSPAAVRLVELISKLLAMDTSSFARRIDGNLSKKLKNR